MTRTVRTTSTVTKMSTVKMSTSVQTEFIHVIRTQHVKTQLAGSHVAAIRDSMEMATIVTTSMHVKLGTSTSVTSY